MRQIKGQITIFDIPEVDFNLMTEQEAVDYINRKLGLRLKYDKFFKDYRQKLKHGFVLSVEYDHYFADDDFDNHNYYDEVATGDLFIGVDIMSSKGGISTPTDSMDEAIETISSYLERWGLK